MEATTPYELWLSHHRTPKIKHFKIFGTDVYTHIPKQLLKKFDAKVKLGIFVGYDNDSKAYRIYRSDKNDVDCKRDVIFRGELQFCDTRLVAPNFLQREGIDFKETFSPVARYDSVRMLFALAANQNLKLRKFDVTTAFLNGKLEEVLYMKQPEGYDDGSGQVLRLKKSLYGLKQALKSWNDEFVKALKTYGFEPTRADPCVFARKKNGEIIRVVLYVDDGAISATSEKKMDEFLNYLRQKFEISQGSMDLYLGIEIERFPDGSIFMHQNK